PAAASSLAASVYGLLPNDTDFTEFKAAGLVGMDFAVVAGSANYETALDTVANADGRSLQDMGDAVLSATRVLAGEDLGAVARGGQVTYFPVVGWLVIYPQNLADALAVLALLALAVAVWFARRRASARLATIGLGALGLLA